MASGTSGFGRQWQIIQWLADSPQGVTVEELAARAECSVRTVRRHLATFRQHDVPLMESVRETGHKAYRIAAIPGEMRFTFDEIVAVYISRRFMEPMMGTCLWRAMHSALTKMRNHLGPTAIHHLEESICTIEPTAFGRGDYRQSVEILDDLNRAIEEKRRVYILYQSAKETRPTTTEINPYTLVYNDGSLYLIGWSHKRRDVRVWKIDRISRVDVINKRFTPPTDFDPAEHLSQSFGIFRTSDDAPPQTIRIRFAADYARRICEKRWHATERYHPQSDGSVILEFDFPGLEAVKRWVIQFGRYAQVIEPQALREMVAGELELAFAQYNLSQND